MSAAPSLETLARITCAEMFVSRNALHKSRDDAAVVARQLFATLAQSVGGYSEGAIERFLQIGGGRASVILAAAATRYEGDAVFRRRVAACEAQALAPLPEEKIDALALRDPDIRAQLEPETLAALDAEHAALEAAARVVGRFGARVAVGRSRAHFETMQRRLRAIARAVKREQERTQA